MRRLIKWVLLGVLVVVGVVGVYFAPRVHRLSIIGAGYIAKQMCSCVFVAERDFASCRADMPPDMALVRAEVLPGERGVHAWIPGIAERAARYTPHTGCTLY